MLFSYSRVSCAEIMGKNVDYKKLCEEVGTSFNKLSLSKSFQRPSKKKVGESSSSMKPDSSLVGLVVIPLDSSLSRSPAIERVRPKVTHLEVASLRFLLIP